LTPNIYLLPPCDHRARRLALFILALAPIAFGLLAVVLGQDANWDLRNYHWYNAYAYLNGRFDVDILPSQTPFFYNPTIDLPFYLLATHAPAKVAGFALGFVQGLNFVLLFMLAYVSLIVPNPRYKVFACASVAALGMIGGGGLALLGATFYDNVTSLGVFLSALLVIRFYDRLLSASWHHLFLLAFLFGVPSGLMMGLKLPSVIFCVGVCFSILGLGGPWHRRIYSCFAFGIGVLFGVTVTLGHWAWFLQTHYGSPLFPYFNQIFKAPLAPLTSARDVAFITHGWRDTLLFPYVFAQSPFRVGEIPWRDWRIPILYGLLPAAILLRLLFGRSSSRRGRVAVPYAARYLLWVGVLSYGVWLGMFCIYRYAVPLEMLAPLLIVFSVGMLPLTLQTRGFLCGFILVVVAVTIQPGNWYRRATWTEPFVSAQIPPLGDTSNLMILMAGFEPYSHILTQFPPEIPIVRIESNFASPDQDKRINAVIHKHVDGHKGRFMLLIPPWQMDLSQEALAYFQLRLSPQDCQSVVDHLYDDKLLKLCKVDRL
jgi:hypothetical protein